ncbi:MAG TPA: hypothetical protein PL072_05425 [Phycisphaerales bacterium]|nr:hypothetical protein [Phycisphaerales bacterium]
MSNICPECGETQGYHKRGCAKCVHTNKNGLFGLECIGCGLPLDGPQYGKRVEVPDVVVEQGPNTNGDIFPDRAQRLRDLADLSFRPAYVTSKPDPKNFFSLKEAIGEAVINVPAVRRVLTLPCPEIEAVVRFHHEYPFGGVGWDANGSPTEEWP